MPHATLVAAVLLCAGADLAPAPDAPAATVAPTAAAAAPAPVKEARALALLKKLGDRLQRTRTFTFKIRNAIEVPLVSGLQATFLNEVAVVVQRPDRVAISRTGDLPEARFAYDGTSMTVFTPRNGHWATTPAPPTIDAMLLAAFEQGNLSFPCDEVLVADPYAALTDELDQAAFLGRTTVAGHRADHLVLAGKGLEVQLWLDATTALPVRAEVIYADHPARPHFVVEYLDWRLDAKVAATAFALPRPSGATPMDFRAVAGTIQ